MDSRNTIRGPLQLDALRELPHQAQFALGAPSDSSVPSLLANVIRRSFELGVIVAQVYRDPGKTVELVGGLANSDAAKLDAITRELEAIKLTLDASIESDIMAAKRALSRVPGLVQRGDLERALREADAARTRALSYADTNQYREHHASAAVGFWTAAEASLYLNDVDEAIGLCSTAVEQVELAYRIALRKVEVSRAGVVTAGRAATADFNTADVALAGTVNLLNGLGKPLPERLEFEAAILPAPKPKLRVRVVRATKEWGPVAAEQVKRLPRPGKK